MTRRISRSSSTPADLALRRSPADPRPEYVGKKRPRLGEPDVKDAATIERMRVAGRIAAQALAEVGKHVAPGVTTDELDRIGHDFLIDARRLPQHARLPRLPRSPCAPR